MYQVSIVSVPRTSPRHDLTWRSSIILVLVLYTEWRIGSDVSERGTPLFYRRIVSLFIRSSKNRLREVETPSQMEVPFVLTITDDGRIIRIIGWTLQSTFRDRGVV